MSRMRFHGAALLCFFALVFATPALADFQGEVVRIIDGDTVVVLVDREQKRVRLADIDAPEDGQAFGTRSRQALAAMIFRKFVLVREKDTDQYGRTLGVIEASGCTSAEPRERPDASCGTLNINAEMVRIGMAWAYRYQNKPTDPRMGELEQQARSKRVGLWSDPHAQEPWRWRRSTSNQ